MKTKPDNISPLNRHTEDDNTQANTKMNLIPLNEQNGKDVQTIRVEKNSEEEDDEEDDEETLEEFEMERILDKREKKGVVTWLVKWKGWEVYCIIRGEL